MSYIAYNNGLSVMWKEPGYVPQTGEVDMGLPAPTPAQLAATFGGYTAAQLAAQITAACQAVDAQAGQTRLKYVTDVPGQADTYTQKGADAAAYKAAGYPFANIASYPWTQAEAVAINGSAITAAQCQAAADGILATQAAWVTKGAAIEQARRAGKIAVGAATSASGVQAAQAAAVQALQAL